MKIRTLLPILGLGALAPAMLAAAPAAQSDPVPAGMLRYPDVSSTHIVFSYANDLWLVSREGGVAMPLASPDGQERFPRFSPDGQSIAFVGNYEGNNDLYTISVQGGVANRVTHHPGTETLSDWMANGDLLFYRNGHAGLARQASIFTVDQAGGMPEASAGSLRNGVLGVGRRQVVGIHAAHARLPAPGSATAVDLATDIWLFNLEDNSAEKITDWEGTDTQPMWWNNALYYLSDQGEANRLNIWKYSPRAKKHEQMTFFKDNDIRWPAVGPGYANQGEIVFQLGSDLVLLNLKFNKLTTVEVIVPGDRPYLRPRTVDASDYIAGWDISPSGKRAVVEARGDIWTLPAENGVPRNLTATNGVGERSPSWSPDGRWIAYFSDETGEYEICVKQSDGKGEVRQLTNGGGVFKLGQGWSPDSKHLMWLDCGGNLMLTTVETSETKQVDGSPFGFWIGSIQSASFSYDSSWITYSRSADDNAQTSIWLYNIESGERHQVTSGFFADGSPAFDRKGEYLYFTSARNFQPSYSAIDSSFIYENSNVLLAVPLKADAERAWAPEHDEESWDEDGAEDDDSEDGEEEATEESDDEGDDDSESMGQVADDGITGTWMGKLTGDEFPPEGIDLTVEMKLEGGNLSGDMTTPMGTAKIDSGSYDAATGEIKVQAIADEGFTIDLIGKVSGNNMTGTGTIPALGAKLAFSLERQSSGGSEGEEDGKSDKKDEPVEKVEIDLEGFEARAIQLPVSPGNFGNLAVNNKNQLIYARRGENGGIKMFDISDDSKSEKSVSAGFGFSMNADGSKMILPRGGSAAIQNASAGASGKTVPTGGMMVRINPREEWKQVFTDAWRIFRDYFYDPNIHGVDWQGVHDHYAAMIDHCASREDVTFLIGEMIAEANVGHAYLRGNGDGAPAGPRVNVGMLGVDWEVHEGAYRIATILRGAAWDSDAISPLGMPGVDVSEGDYVLAVNGLPLSTDEDPYAAFQGMASKEVVLTVSTKPSMDEEARDVIVKTMGSESTLRMRAWIEKNRKYVSDMTDGRVGYIYVPDTGLNGQNNLFRQFYGQSLKDALIIDERWNGGGQIPTRFIELLNRPATNYWATRGQQDIHWPPDSHQGPKAMLINEDAGSGGDAFPHYFRQAGIGKLIGRRTWGGLVGISGNPSLIDGGQISVPTFAFYDTDGTWGIEGHGVDPDIEVMDHPALMVEGGDPQLDAGIKHILSELERNGYKKPSRPAYPDRSGLGITEEDK